MEGKATLRLYNPVTAQSDRYDVYHCDYSLDKQVSKAGNVGSDVLAGNIRVFLPVLPTGELMRWVFDSQKKLNGEITVNDALEETLEKVAFEEGRCTGFRLHYEPGKYIHNVVLCLTINAQRMIIGNVEYNNPFRKR
ncbi:MAG: hypothetical protein LBD45_00795 [Bacteroidales bacterium]|jgi:hypothetical protein|nr:hypothetical protein [Bacteroidales bacterium]